MLSVESRGSVESSKVVFLPGINSYSSQLDVRQETSHLEIGPTAVVLVAEVGLDGWTSLRLLRSSALQYVAVH